MSVEIVLRGLQSRGVVFTVVDGQIKYDSPPGVMTDQVRTFIFDNGDDIVRQLIIDTMTKPIDPRDDMVDDHDIWVEVLTSAFVMDRKLWGLLRGFRICGCRVIERGNGKLRFELDELCKELGVDEDDFKKEWIDSVREQIAYLFRKVMR